MRSWLTTDLDTSLRAYGFYRRQGWTDWKIERGLRWMEISLTIDEVNGPLGRKVQRVCHDTLPWLISTSLDLVPVALAALFPLLAVLVGCTELPLQKLPTIVLDGIPIYGRVDQVPKPELRAAIALDRSLMSGAAGKIYLIDVMSPQELHVYHTPRNPRWEEY